MPLMQLLQLSVRIPVITMMTVAAQWMMMINLPQLNWISSELFQEVINHTAQKKDIHSQWKRLLLPLHSYVFTTNAAEWIEATYLKHATATTEFKPQSYVPPSTFVLPQPPVTHSHDSPQWHWTGVHHIVSEQYQWRETARILVQIGAR